MVSQSLLEPITTPTRGLLGVSLALEVSEEEGVLMKGLVDGA
jgi:hypothetical protein